MFVLLCFCLVFYSLVLFCFYIYIMRYKQILVTLLVIFQHVTCYFPETLLHLLVLKVVVLWSGEALARFSSLQSWKFEDLCFPYRITSERPGIDQSLWPQWEERLWYVSRKQKTQIGDRFRFPPKNKEGEYYKWTFSNCNPLLRTSKFYCYLPPFRHSCTNGSSSEEHLSGKTLPLVNSETWHVHSANDLQAAVIVIVRSLGLPFRFQNCFKSALRKFGPPRLSRAAPRHKHQTQPHSRSVSLQDWKTPKSVTVVNQGSKAIRCYWSNTLRSIWRVVTCKLKLKTASGDEIVWFHCLWQMVYAEGI